MEMSISSRTLEWLEDMVGWMQSRDFDAEPALLQTFEVCL